MDTATQFNLGYERVREMTDQEKQQAEEDLSKEERLLKYIESEIIFDADKSNWYKRMSAGGCAFASTWLVGKSVKRQEGVLAELSACVHRQEEINAAILEESVAVKRLTWGVLILTAAVVGLTIALLFRG